MEARLERIEKRLAAIEEALQPSSSLIPQPPPLPLPVHPKRYKPSKRIDFSVLVNGDVLETFTVDDLTVIFSTYGTVSKVYPIDKDPKGNLRARVVFSTEEEMRACIADKKDLDESYSLKDCRAFFREHKF